VSGPLVSGERAHGIQWVELVGVRAGVDMKTKKSPCQEFNLGRHLNYFFFVQLSRLLVGFLRNETHIVIPMKLILCPIQNSGTNKLFLQNLKTVLLEVGTAH
jgi:hypothetical protein